MDQGIRDVLTALITVLALAGLIGLALEWLGRSRPGLAIGTPVAVAFTIRILVAVGVSLAPFGDIGTSDESFFLAQAEQLGGSSTTDLSWADALTDRLHVFAFGAQMLVLDSPDVVLRIAQGGISVLGLVLLAAAVYELAGPRAAIVASWIIALEPSNVLFSVVLHKEPNMMLAGGLVALGGATLWKRGTLWSLFPIAIGCMIASATRFYAGWFLIAAAAATTLHAGVRYWNRAAFRSVVMISTVVLLAALAAPTVWRATGGESLEEVQARQETIVSEDPNANLDLEQVDYSTRWGVVVNLPQRMVDIVTRPYPWEVANLSQRLALFGNLVAWAVLAFVVRELWRGRGRIMERVGPLIYIGGFLFAAYALSAGNAGTAFRYRTHLIAIAVAIAVALWGARSREPVAVRGPRASGVRRVAPASLP